MLTIKLLYSSTTSGVRKKYLKRNNNTSLVAECKLRQAVTKFSPKRAGGTSNHSTLYTDTDMAQSYKHVRRPQILDDEAVDEDEAIERCIEDSSSSSDDHGELNDSQYQRELKELEASTVPTNNDDDESVIAMFSPKKQQLQLEKHVQHRKQISAKKPAAIEQGAEEYDNDDDIVVHQSPASPVRKATKTAPNWSGEYSSLLLPNPTQKHPSLVVPPKPDIPAPPKPNSLISAQPTKPSRQNYQEIIPPAPNHSHSILNEISVLEGNTSRNQGSNASALNESVFYFPSPRLPVSKTPAQQMSSSRYNGTTTTLQRKAPQPKRPQSASLVRPATVQPRINLRSPTSSKNSASSNKRPISAKPVTALSGYTNGITLRLQGNTPLM